MEVYESVKKAAKTLVAVRAYKGDAMTLLAFDLHKTMLDNFAGFSIHIKANPVNNWYKLYYYLFNKLTFSKAILKKNEIDDKEKLSSEFSPFQKFNWVHVPSTDHILSRPYFGDYIYSVTPRYLKDGILLPVDKSLTVRVTIDVSPFHIGGVKLGFARGFISSQAYVRRFGMNNRMRPNEVDLLFNLKEKSGSVKRLNSKTQVMETVDYTYEEQHKYLGWQVRERVLEFLEETLADKDMSLEVFAYDLTEPVIANFLLQLAKKGRLRMILDDAGSHGKAGRYEAQFEQLFREQATGASILERGHFAALSHSKVFIQLRKGIPVKVLSGSTNFSTNGIYVNANHVIIFDNPVIAKLYADVFAASLGKVLMQQFKNTKWAIDDHLVKELNMPGMTIRFAPHKKAVTDVFFSTISSRIDNAKSDLLFAIMEDTSVSSILSSVRNQVQNTKVFTYGITDTISNDKDEVMLYKPNNKRGIRIAARGGSIKNVLPKPFDTVPKIDGYAIHHKFVVVDFKGKDPVVYCGSSNLAVGPEQRNGDNLIEIRNRDIVIAFAIEAFRLVEHFHWRNKELTDDEILLNDLSRPASAWYKKYYNSKDLRCIERELFISESID